MPTFKDANGREWTVKLDAPLIQDIRSDCDVDLVGNDPSTFQRLGSDLILAINVLWVMCRKQAQSVGITDVQFGEALFGDALGNAMETMEAAILDFFPPRRRMLLKKILQKGREVEEMGTEELLKQLDDPKVRDALLTQTRKQAEKSIQSITESIQSSNVTNSQEFAESTRKAGR